MRSHVMIDLETMGNDYDGVFTTIGACVFEPMTGEITKVFYMSVSWESSIEAGRTFTPDTIKWWMSQSDTARAEACKAGHPLEFVLRQFAAWLPKNSIVWGNGPTFDIGKLETAYGYYAIPWRYSDVRCVRTMREIGGDLVNPDSIPREGEKHNALDDAVWQAKYVSAIWQALRSPNAHSKSESHGVPQ